MTTPPHRGHRAHVVLVHRYFDPDTPPYASILKEIALGLAAEGMRVTVLTCQPSYNRGVVSSAAPRERLAPNVDVVRWRVLPDRTSSLAKLANLVLFAARVAVRLPRLGRVDAVMAASTPPVLPAMTVSLLAKALRVPFVYHKQDIYPEVTDTANPLPGWVRRALRAVDARTDRRAAAVVVLSDDMADTVVARGTPRAGIEVINNFDPWHLGEPAGPDRRTAVTPDDPVRFLFAGNLGRFQNLELLGDTLARFADDPRARFDFIGDGALKTYLEDLVRNQGWRHVRVRGYVAPERLAGLMRNEYDIGIVSLHPGVIACAYPSKTLSYLRNGLPVLALVESDSQLAAQLRSYAAGWTVDPVRGGSAGDQIERILGERDRLTQLSAAARRMYDGEFGRKQQLTRWTSLFARLTEDDRR